MRVLLLNPTISPIRIAENSEKLIGKKVNEGTLRRKMKSMDFKTYVIRKVMDITPNNQAKRLAFAREHINKPIEFWHNVLWTDESSFQFQGSFGRKYMHLPSTLKSKARQPLNRFGGGSVMFWGCISFNGFGELVPLNGTLNQSGYIDVLNNHAFPSANRLFPNNYWILQQDNAPCHKGWLVTKFLKEMD